MVTNSLHCVLEDIQLPTVISGLESSPKPMIPVCGGFVDVYDVVGGVFKPNPVDMVRLYDVNSSVNAEHFSLVDKFSGITCWSDTDPRSGVLFESTSTCLNESGFDNDQFNKSVAGLFPPTLDLLSKFTPGAKFLHWSEAHNKRCQICQSCNLDQDWNYLLDVHCQVYDSGMANYVGCRIPVKSSGLKIDYLREVLKDYHDYKLVEYLEFGFPIGLNVSREDFVKPFKVRNHLGALQNISGWSNLKTESWDLLGQLMWDIIWCSHLLTVFRKENLQKEE